jgi:hypothetical protein
MCLNTWSFKPVNVDKISCINCVLRWTWDAQHISSTNPEKYENCIDVTIMNSPENSSNSADSSDVSDSAKPGKILPESDSNLNGSTSTQQKALETTPASSEPTHDDANSAVRSSGSEAQANDCACDLSVDSHIYSQCTADGNYCTCFRGPWSALGNVKMNCAPGTTCRQSDSQIHCQ